MSAIERQQLRKKLRTIVKETLSFILDEIEDEVQQELLIQSSRKLRKRKWVQRGRPGANDAAYKEFGVEDPNDYVRAFHMTEETFNCLLEKIEPHIQKSDTIMRTALPAVLKLQTVLYLLTSGVNYSILELLFGISKPTISVMLPEVCDAIFNALKDYIQTPRNEEDWKRIEDGFNKIWNLPRCCGAIEAKQIVMKVPYETDQNHVFLMVMCDDNYCFKYIDISCAESLSDGEMLQNSELWGILENNVFPENNYIVGNDSFPLKKYLMKPYEGNNLSNKQKVFNLRLASAKHIIENSFGMLVSCFKIFENPFLMTPDRIGKIVRACCALHNWLRMTDSAIEVTTIDEIDIITGEFTPGSWREMQIEGIIGLPPIQEDCPSQEICKTRDMYADFFTDETELTNVNRLIQ